MTGKHITITSKNQITLPADYVRKMQLNAGRRMSVRMQGGRLVLEPQQNLLDRMQKHWVHQKGKQPLNDAELKQAIRESVATAWSEKEKRAS